MDSIKAISINLPSARNRNPNDSSVLNSSSRKFLSETARRRNIKVKLSLGKDKEKAKAKISN